jgi:hypothetical protein
MRDRMRTGRQIVSVDERLSRLEKRHAITTAALSLVIAGLIGVTANQAYQLRAKEPTSLRVKELRVYDDKGVDRVVIAGDLPQALYKGKPMKGPPRSMAGMLIIDETSTERGGYGTANGYANAMFTLDAQGEQVFLMLAEPDGGPFFRAWKGDKSVTFGASEEPFLTLRSGKDVVFAKPEDNAWTTRDMR